MKKIIILSLMLLLLLPSCGSGEKDDTTVTEAEATATETAEPYGEFDFENANITDHKTVNAGDEFMLEWQGEEFISSHPSVCAVEGKKVTALKSGVSLLGVAGEKNAYAICVLPEGATEDAMAGEPTLLEVGKTAFVEGFGSSEHFTVSDPEVAELDGAVVKALSPGYVIIDVSNISMPKFFSFIVYDRLTDNK